MRNGHGSQLYVIRGVRNTIWFNSKNPLNGFFEAKYLFTRDFEFGMTQSFLGQTDGTSRTGMARNP